MIEVLILAMAAVAVVGMITGAVMAHKSRQPTWLDRVTADHVVVHTVDGTSFAGLLAETAADGVVLRAARMLDHDVDLAGDVFVPRGRVAFVQRGEVTT